jgi:hypothetical protein
MSLPDTNYGFKAMGDTPWLKGASDLCPPKLNH